MKMAWQNPPVIYARGRVVLWTNRENLCRAGDWKSAIRDAGVRKIAIVSGTTSPYGEAAESALRKEGLWDAVKPRFVYAQDVTQAFQYVYSGAAAAGFCALAGCRLRRGQGRLPLRCGRSTPSRALGLRAEKSEKQGSGPPLHEISGITRGGKKSNGIRVPVNGLAPTLPVDETGPHLHGHPPGCRRPAGRSSGL